MLNAFGFDHDCGTTGLLRLTMRHSSWRADIELKLNEAWLRYNLMKMASSGIWGLGWMVGGNPSLTDVPGSYLAGLGWPEALGGSLSLSWIGLRFVESPAEIHGQFSLAWRLLVPFLAEP